MDNYLISLFGLGVQRCAFEVIAYCGFYLLSYVPCSEPSPNYYKGIGTKSEVKCYFKLKQ